MSGRPQSHHGGRVGRRPNNSRPTRRRFLIICEGQKTEPLCFQEFKVPKEVCQIIGLGTNTLNLVEQAISIRDDYRRRDESFDEIWCVFDRDSFPAQQFNEAIRLAQTEGMKVAYSNEAFELWYVLHFGYHQSSWTCQALIEKLQQLLSRGYTKNNPDIYALLQSRQQTALANAYRLLSEYPNHNPEQDNPCTTVHLLVEKLNENLPGR